MNRPDLESALTAFQDAAAALAAAWEDHPGDAIAQYPEGWPTFESVVWAIGEMTVRHDRDMSDIARRVRLQGIPCYVDQTGGGCATIYAGESVDTEDGPEYPVAAGPGEFYAPGGPTADDRELYVGPTGDSPQSDYTDCTGKSEAEIAAEIVRYVKANSV